MTRVVHVSSVHPLNDTRILHRECRTLADAGYETILIIQHSRDEVLNGVRILGLPTFSNRLARMVVGSLFALARAIKISGDLYHLHDPELVPAGLILKIMGYKVILDVHEDVPAQMHHRTWLPGAFRLPLAVTTEICEWAVARYFDAIVCATPHIAERFLGYNPHSVIVPNYPELAEFADTIPWRDRPIELCYVGAISRERGVFEMIEAAARVGVRLHLVGDMSSALLDELKRHSDWGNVTCYGRLDRRGVAAILSQSKIGLVCLHPTPNYINAWPVKLFEYMAAGTPFVASDFNVWRNIVDNARAGLFVAPGQSKPIEMAVRAILADPNLAVVMAERGREFARTELCWSKAANTLLAIYEDVLV